MDAEIVAINPNTSELLTFQELSNRQLKDVKLQDVKVAVCVFSFDLLYLDGEVMLPSPLGSSFLLNQLAYHWGVISEETATASNSVLTLPA
jgi:hypothetical protein